MILDTCALLWRSFEKEKLSQKAVRAISNATELLINQYPFGESALRLKGSTL